MFLVTAHPALAQQPSAAPMPSEAGTPQAKQPNILMIILTGPGETFLAGIRSRPIERNVFAGPVLTGPLKAEPVGPQFDRLAPSSDMAGTYFGARRIYGLHTLSSRRCGSGLQ